VVAESLSVIVEWENVLLAESTRCDAMLATLAREVGALTQAGAVSTPIQLLVCFDETEVDADAVAASVGREIALEGGPFAVALVPAAGAEYYELKNAAARMATGDIVVFVDSDVIPEQGWLGDLLRPFEDENVGVVAGNSYIEPVGLYGKAFALGWFFPLRSTERVVRPAVRFFANNAAFRRDILQRFPFPELEGTSRGSCWRLSTILRENDVQIVESTGARVAHPPPNGLVHFLRRAIAEGRDRYFAAIPYGTQRPRVRVGTLGRLRRHLRTSTTSILRDFDRVGLPAPEVPVAIAISGSYYVLCTVGELMTIASPRFMMRHFRI
jgi:hypothetical protein